MDTSDPTRTTGYGATPERNPDDPRKRADYNLDEPRKFVEDPRVAVDRTAAPGRNERRWRGSIESPDMQPKETRPPMEQEARRLDPQVQLVRRWVLIRALVNDDRDSGNIQIQIGNEHAVPSLADLDACRPSSEDLRAEVGFTEEWEKEDARLRSDAAKLADQQQGLTPEEARRRVDADQRTADQQQGGSAAIRRQEQAAADARKRQAGV